MRLMQSCAVWLGCGACGAIVALLLSPFPTLASSQEQLPVIDGGGLVIRDRAGNERLKFAVTDDNAGSLLILSSDGSRSISMSSLDDGSLSVYLKYSESRSIYLGGTPDGLFGAFVKNGDLFSGLGINERGAFCSVNTHREQGLGQLFAPVSPDSGGAFLSLNDGEGRPRVYLGARSDAKEGDYFKLIGPDGAEVFRR